MSPYLKELVCYIGQSECYKASSELLEKTTQIEVDDNTIHRLCNEIGEECEIWLDEHSKEPVNREEIKDNEVVYGHFDGMMALTRKQGWKEIKVGRLYKSEDLLKLTKDRGYIHNSKYTFHLGGHKEFEDKMSNYLDSYEYLQERLVIIIDGATWMRNWVNAGYPRATQILDYYHAIEHFGKLGSIAIKRKDERDKWIEKVTATLKESGGGGCIKIVADLNCTTKKQRKEKENLLKYIENNKFRMDYPEYIKRGLQIASGAMESAHRTLVQKRCKLSGQRWTPKGLTNILNIRNLRMNGSWNILTDYLKKAA
jgi:hypothetical protein